MTYELKNNTGSIFANERREKDTHPNAKGTAMIDGREFWVDAWTNTAANGKKYQSLRFKLKEQHGGQQGGYAASPPAADDDADFIPF